MKRRQAPLRVRGKGGSTQSFVLEVNYVSPKTVHNTRPEHILQNVSLRRTSQILWQEVIPQFLARGFPLRGIPLCIFLPFPGRENYAMSPQSVCVILVPRGPRSFWSAPKIATPGLVQHRKSAIYDFLSNLTKLIG